MFFKTKISAPDTYDIRYQLHDHDHIACICAASSSLESFSCDTLDGRISLSIAFRWVFGALAQPKKCHRRLSLSMKMCRYLVHLMRSVHNLDMQWHTLALQNKKNVMKFSKIVHLLITNINGKWLRLWSLATRREHKTNSSSNVWMEFYLVENRDQTFVVTHFQFVGWTDWFLVKLPLTLSKLVPKAD